MRASLQKNHRRAIDHEHCHQKRVHLVQQACDQQNLDQDHGVRATAFQKQHCLPTKKHQKKHYPHTPKRRRNSQQSVALSHQKPGGQKNNARQKALKKTKQGKEKELCLPETWNLHNNQSSKSCFRFLSLRLEKRYSKKALGSSSVAEIVRRHQKTSFLFSFCRELDNSVTCS